MQAHKRLSQFERAMYRLRFGDSHPIVYPIVVTLNRRNTLIIATCVLILVSLPHVIEDFQYGALVRFGVTLPLGIAVLLIMYSLQLGALGLLLAGSSRPALVLAFTGAVWSIGAALIHGHDLIFAGENYRHGPVSKVLEVLIIVFGAVVCLTGIRVANTRPAGHHLEEPKRH